MWDGTITETNMLKQIKNVCACRFERYRPDPCKGCAYRNRWRTENDYQTCIFDNCPRDWNIDQHDN